MVRWHLWAVWRFLPHCYLRHMLKAVSVLTKSVFYSFSSNPFKAHSQREASMMLAYGPCPSGFVQQVWGRPQEVSFFHTFIKVQRQHQIPHTEKMLLFSSFCAIFTSGKKGHIHNHNSYSKLYPGYLIPSVSTSPQLPREMFRAVNYFSHFTVEGTEDGRG